MNLGVIIGAAALGLGFASLVFALVLRTEGRTNSARLLRYFFFAGIPIGFLCSAAGFWDCYASGDWTKCLVPIALLLFATNGLINRRRCIDLIDNLACTKQALDNGKKAINSQEEK